MSGERKRTRKNRNALNSPNQSTSAARKSFDSFSIDAGEVLGCAER